MITINFEFDDIYKDALILSDDHGLTDAEIEDMKQQRYDNWKTIINTPPLPPQEDQPSQEELL
jgi:hypothetical protein